MKILQTEFLIRKGKSRFLKAMDALFEEIREAILSVIWPPKSDRFILHPTRMGNGVVPIKKNCMGYLVEKGWEPAHRIGIASRLKPGPIDAVKALPDGRWMAVEWETGNISSSHRALNKIGIGLIDGILAGGFLILPSRNMYQYLTDRVGNFAEIEPYFPIWRSLPVDDGVLGVVEIEQDDVSVDVPLIKKGTDGRALR